MTIGEIISHNKFLKSPFAKVDFDFVAKAKVSPVKGGGVNKREALIRGGVNKRVALNLSLIHI